MNNSSTNNLTQWQKFAAHLHSLNEAAPSSVSYKLLFLGRHGEGYHNVIEADVGSPAWNCYWSRRDNNGTGPGTISWSDAHLTPLGEDQALTAHKFWNKSLTDATVAISAPQRWFVSPLHRTLQTANITWSHLSSSLPAKQQYAPVIKERLREGLGVHTCDRRPSRTIIADEWSHKENVSYVFERDFSEPDLLWNTDYRESGSHHAARMLLFLDDVFSDIDASTSSTIASAASAKDVEFVSATAHSGSINSLLGAVGHRGFQLQTGGVIPVFLKATRHEGSTRTLGKISPPHKEEICASPPAKDSS